MTSERNDDDRTVVWEALADTLRPYAGWLFFGFGALLVVIGYFGISGEAVVAKQLPYLISGGLGGVLLAILGGYFLAMEELRRDSGRLNRMERQIEELHRALLARDDAPDLGDAAAPATTTEVVPAAVNGHARRPAPVDDHVVAVPSGSSFHRPSCALVAAKDATPLTAAEAGARGLRPCGVCDPQVALTSR